MTQASLRRILSRGHRSLLFARPTRSGQGLVVSASRGFFPIDSAAAGRDTIAYQRVQFHKRQQPPVGKRAAVKPMAIRCQYSFGGRVWLRIRL